MLRNFSAFVFFDAICIAMVLFSFYSAHTCFAARVDEVGDALKEAEADLGYAFVAVAEAEDAGANVSALLYKLNDAGGFLSEGYAAFRDGDYEAAFSFASACIDALEGVADEAGRLESSATRIRGDGVILAVVCSVVGLVALFVFGFLGWSYLKESYSRKSSI